MNRIALISTLSLAALAAPEAHAYRYWKCWTGAKLNWADSHTSFDANANTFPPGSAAAKAIERAMSKLNEAPLDYSVSLHLDPDELVGFGNLESELYLADIDAPASCRWQADLVFSCYLTEADVRISSAWWADGKYTTGNAKTPNEAYGGGPRLLETDLLHEMGHCLGLQHEDRYYSVMGQSWTHVHANGEKIAGYLGVDSTKGLRFLYGGASRGENLAVTHWKWSGSTDPGCDGGEDCYSKHARTGIEKAASGSFFAGATLPKQTIGGEPRYTVIRGQKLVLEMGYENLGPTEQKSMIELVVSKDSTIDTGDPATLGKPIALTLAGVSITHRKDALTLPANLESGAHFLGAILDPAGDLAETDETDNASYVEVLVIDPSKPSALAQSLPIGGSRALTMDLANGYASMSPIVLSAKVGGYGQGYAVDKCRVGFYVHKSTEAPNPKYPHASSAWAAPGATVSVTIPILPVGAYRWSARTQCANEALGFGSPLAAHSSAPADFTITAATLHATPMPPVAPFGLEAKVFPKSLVHKLWVDGEARLDARSFDPNGDAVRFEFLAVRTHGEDFAPIAPELVASEALAPLAPSASGLSLGVAASFAFDIDAGRYVWTVRACDATACSAWVTGPSFEIEQPSLESACEPQLGWCDAERAGFFFGPLPPLTAPLPPDPTPWLASLAATPAEIYRAARSAGPGMVRGTLVRTARGALILSGARALIHAPRSLGRDAMDYASFRAAP